MSTFAFATLFCIAKKKNIITHDSHETDLPPTNEPNYRKKKKQIEMWTFDSLHAHTNEIIIDYVCVVIIFRMDFTGCRSIPIRSAS